MDNIAYWICELYAEMTMFAAHCNCHSINQILWDMVGLDLSNSLQNMMSNPRLALQAYDLAYENVVMYLCVQMPIYRE